MSSESVEEEPPVIEAEARPSSVEELKVFIHSPVDITIAKRARDVEIILMIGAESWLLGTSRVYPRS
jgi:hypothetical protein